MDYVVTDSEQNYLLVMGIFYLLVAFGITWFFVIPRAVKLLNIYFDCHGKWRGKQ